MKEQSDEMLSSRDGQEDLLLPGPGLLITRGIFYIILVGLVGFGAWAYFTEIQIVAEAQGKLVVQDEKIALSVDEDGRAIEIAVDVGQRVEAGEKLLRLDDFEYRQQLALLSAESKVLDCECQQMDIRRKHAKETFAIMQRESETLEKTQDLLSSQLTLFRELSTKKKLISRLDADAKALEVLNGESRLIQLETQFKRQQNTIQQLEKDAAVLQERKQQLAVKMACCQARIQRTVLYAPVAGTIVDLAAAHAGSQVLAEQPAVILAPGDLPLCAMISIPNSAIRRLHVGLPVRLRFDAYPYQDYGDVKGTLCEIEPDADSEGSYQAWVKLETNTLQGPHGRETLRPGLTMNAFIVIERRTLLQEMLRPFLKLRQPITISE